MRWFMYGNGVKTSGPTCVWGCIIEDKWVAHVGLPAVHREYGAGEGKYTC